MGRQIRFYMLNEDDLNFIRFIKTIDGANFCREKFNNYKDMELDPEGIFPKSMMDTGSLVIAFEQLNIIQKSILKIKSTVYPNSTFYRIDTLNAPVIEFMRCFFNPDGELIQGRLWVEMYALEGNQFKYKGDLIKKRYECITGWIKRHYKKIEDLDGYFGPEAEKMYLHGKLRLFIYSHM